MDLRVDMDMVDEWHLLPTKSESATAGPVTVMDVSDGWNVNIPIIPISRILRYWSTIHIHHIMGVAKYVTLLTSP